MAIVNRTLDPSQQQVMQVANYGAVVTGATLHVAVIPSPSILKQIKIAVAGVSGTPTYDLRVLRFIVGSGVTSIAGGATTLTGTAVGTSGIQTLVLAAAGSSFLSLIAGDLLTLTSGGANSAVTNISVASVIQDTQDILSWF